MGTLKSLALYDCGSEQQSLGNGIGRLYRWSSYESRCGWRLAWPDCEIYGGFPFGIRLLTQIHHDLERLADLVIQRRTDDQQISEVSTSAAPEGATVEAREY